MDASKGARVFLTCRNWVSCFERTGVEDVSVPDSVCELCDHCFAVCESLHRVMFGSVSSLERVGVG